MIDTTSPPAVSPAAPTTPRPSARPVLILTLIALPAGWLLLSLPIVLGLPVELFVLATLYLAMVPTALLLTRRAFGRAGVATLLRSAVTLPRPWIWLIVALVGLPALSLLVAGPLGGVQPLTGDLLGGAAVQFWSGLVLVNLAEEMVWMRFVQHRLMARWGLVRGSLVTSLLFAGIHLPLAFADGLQIRTVLTGAALLFAASALIRLLFGAVYTLTGGGVLVIAVMHASYNLTGSLLAPAYALVQLGVLAVLTLVLLLAYRRHHLKEIR